MQVSVTLCETFLMGTDFNLNVLVVLRMEFFDGGTMFRHQYFIV